MDIQILRVRYYWPTIAIDCTSFVQKCVPCQKHGNISHQRHEELHIIFSSWPYAKWGDGHYRPFPTRKGTSQVPISGSGLLH